MGILSGNSFQKKVLPLPIWYRLRGGVTLALLLVLTTGCNEVSLTARQLPTLLPDLSTNAKFELKVTPSERAGVYTITGTTNLPEKSRIGVAAIRYLQVSKPQSQNLKPHQTYSILAYQDVTVQSPKKPETFGLPKLKANLSPEPEEKKWQATLNLWKVAPNGQYKEAWQLEQLLLGLKLEPEPGVLFLATVEPTDSLSELEQQLRKQDIKLVSNIVRNTVEGEQYVQASQVLTVALPIGQTTPRPPRPDDLNGGWGPRYLLIPEPPNTNKFEQPDKRRTNAPLVPGEYLQ